MLRACLAHVLSRALKNREAVNSLTDRGSVIIKIKLIALDAKRKKWDAVGSGLNLYFVSHRNSAKERRERRC